MSNLSMVLNKAFEDVNSDQWQKEYEEIYNMDLIKKKQGAYASCSSFF